MKPAASTADSKKRKADDAAEEPAKKVAKAAAGEEEDDEEAPKQLWVGQLSWNVDNDWLKQEFSELGEVTGARVMTDRESGRSRGCVVYLDVRATLPSAD